MESLAPKSRLAYGALVDSTRDQVVDISHARDQVTHCLLSDPSPNRRAERLALNSNKLHQVEVFLAATVPFRVMFNPNDLVGLQTVLATHGRCEMLREIGHGSARIVWQLHCDKYILAVASPMRFDIAARIAVPKSPVVVSHLRRLPLPRDQRFRITLKLALDQDNRESLP